jgi:hypothetical protein
VRHQYTTPAVVLLTVLLLAASALFAWVQN